MNSTKILGVALATIVCMTSIAQERIHTTRSTAVDLEMPDEDEGFVFVVFGDRTGGPAEGIAVLQEAVRDTNLLDPDLVMTVGDLVEGYNGQDLWMRQMTQFKTVMQGLDCPWFPVAGNHDIYWRGANRPENEHESNYEEHFGPLWYDFEHRNCHFIVLYTDEPNPKTGERNYTKPTAQIMSDEQLTFLRQALDRGSSADHVFVFLHHPRWLKGGYGDDWDRTHAVLAEAGNVSACFAGHIHQMRHDGVRDGIEYISLATVGAHQNFFSPEAGWDHQFHVVTVRPDRVSMAAVPVNEILDVRDITGTVSSDARRLARLRPQIASPLSVDSQGSVNDRIGAALTNPTGRPVMVEIAPYSADARWRFAPTRSHQRIGPGETAVFTFEATRSPLPIDNAFSPPGLAVDIEYLTDLRSYTIPTTKMLVPVAVQLDAPVQPEQNSALSLSGGGAALRIEDAKVTLADGPFTLEATFVGEDFSGSRGIVAKTESSEYGIFASDGVPSFWVFLGESYVTVEAPNVVLQPNARHQLAGVFDGKELRLYLDGKLVATKKGSGSRKQNNLPLLIGGDVTAQAQPAQSFQGVIDEVRLSNVARYSGDQSEIPQRFQSDSNTVMLFHFDGAYGPYHHDSSGNDAHATALGGASLVTNPQ